MTDQAPAVPPPPAAPAAGPGAGDPGGAIATMPFDAALAELQGVVGRLEQGNLPLEESIALYERGVALHEHCARLLTDAELRVQRLVESAGGALRALDLTPDGGEEA
ncbi:MAG TPA: exodeoxyribonuclease VII small subunit [Candidatus Baltobacteraceae bacterium]|nr:exodeoxyribonuclease VII small subunit [Candidatus Baltobacteraceae bacterium]